MSRYLTQELSPNDAAKLEDHIQECVACRQSLSFHKELSSRLDGAPALPNGLASNARHRLDQVASLRKSKWLILLQGNTTMKRLMISTTALAAICAGVLMILPTAATAATPLETFKKMRGALSLAANRGELAVRVLAKPNGEVDVTGTLDGVKLPDSFPLKVVSKQDDDIVNVAISVDLDPTHFSSIKYGKTPNTLHMVYKEIPNSIIVVQLDPKSMLPTSWTTEELWAEVVPTTTFNRKEVEAPAKNLETMMHVRVRLRIGQEATVSINATEK